MLIKRVKIKNHPGIGDLDINFADDDGNVHRTIILAGENGTGKTAILEAIQAGLEGNYQVDIGQITLYIELETSDLGALGDVLEIIRTPRDAARYIKEFSIKVDTSVKTPFNAFVEYIDGTGSTSSSQAILSTEQWQKLLRTFYSEANVSFTGRIPQSITSRRVDDPNVRRARSGSSLADEVTQLLIDIRAADNEDLAKWAEANPGKIIPDSIKSVRSRRFTDSFSYIFPTKRFRGNCTA